MTDPGDLRTLAKRMYEQEFCSVDWHNCADAVAQCLGQLGVGEPVFVAAFSIIDCPADFSRLVAAYLDGVRHGGR